MRCRGASGIPCGGRGSTTWEALRESGQLIAAEALQSARTGVVARVRRGQLSTTDGPFAETKEQLGGIFLIEARDLNDAIRIASRWPSARIGSIEVRPVEETLREQGRYADRMAMTSSRRAE